VVVQATSDDSGPMYQEADCMNRHSPYERIATFSSSKDTVFSWLEMCPTRAYDISHLGICCPVPRTIVRSHSYQSAHGEVVKWRLLSRLYSEIDASHM
jgi:hypothetical protein